MPTSNPTGDDFVGTAGSQAAFGSQDLVDTLALLHADALEEPERGRAQAAAAADPAAQAILAGLDMVCAQLRKLDQVLPPSEPMPELVARRLDRELAKLGSSVEGNRRRWATAASVGSVAAAAAVLSLVTYAAWPRTEQNSPGSVPQAQVPSAQVPSSAKSNAPTVVDDRFRIERKDLSTLLTAKPNFADLGPLADENVRSGCLAANGFVGQTPVAAGRIARGDKEGIFMMIPTPSNTGPVMTVLVVGTQCRAGVPDLLSKQVFGKN